MKKLVIIGMIMAINSTAFAQVTTLTDRIEGSGRWRTACGLCQ